MPTYEYKCKACGEQFEKFQSITAAPVRKCPKCGKNKVERLISAGAGLIFKGSGFYITDYRDSSYTEKAKADSGSGETKSDKGDSKSTGGDGKPSTGDAKPAAKAESSSSESSSSSKPESKPAPSAGKSKGGKESGKKR